MKSLCVTIKMYDSKAHSPFGVLSPQLHCILIVPLVRVRVIEPHEGLVGDHALQLRGVFLNNMLNQVLGVLALLFDKTGSKYGGGVLSTNAERCVGTQQEHFLTEAT